MHAFSYSMGLLAVGISFAAADTLKFTNVKIVVEPSAEPVAKVTAPVQIPVTPSRVTVLESKRTSKVSFGSGSKEPGSAVVVGSGAPPPPPVLIAPVDETPDAPEPLVNPFAPSPPEAPEVMNVGAQETEDPSVATGAGVLPPLAQLPPVTPLLAGPKVPPRAVAVGKIPVASAIDKSGPAIPEPPLPSAQPVASNAPSVVSPKAPGQPKQAYSDSESAALLNLVEGKSDLRFSQPVVGKVW